MENEQFIKQFIEHCDKDRFKLSELQHDKCLIDWVERETLSGKSFDDEHYNYMTTGFDNEIGGRLSFLPYVDQNSMHVDLESGAFPMCADSFFMNGKRYWVVTMMGQGAVSWIYTDETFTKEFQR